MPEQAKADDAIQTEVSLEFTHTELKVEDIMTGTIISVAPQETVHSAIREMAKYKISCIFIASGGEAVGILTERDVLRGVATRYDDFMQAAVVGEMSKPVIAVCPKMTALAASKLMASRKIKRLLVVSDQQPIGVVTQTDISSALISMAPFRNIADLMTPKVVWVDETATLTEAAQLMAANNISCVVILRAGKPIGIVTEKDIVHRTAQSREDPTTAPITEIMSSPVATVPPTHSVMSASRVMDQMRIHRLLVGSTTDVQGIVTQTDIITAVQEKLEDARLARLQQKAEMVLMVNAAMANLSSIQSLCWRILSSQLTVSEPVGSAPLPERMLSDRSDIVFGPDGQEVCDDPILEELQTRIAETRNSLEKLAKMA